MNQMVCNHVPLGRLIAPGVTGPMLRQPATVRWGYWNSLFVINRYREHPHKPPATMSPWSSSSCLGTQQIGNWGQFVQRTSRQGIPWHPAYMPPVGFLTQGDMHNTKSRQQPKQRQQPTQSQASQIPFYSYVKYNTRDSKAGVVIN